MRKSKKDREELKSLMIRLGEITLDDADYGISTMTNEDVRKLLSKKREMLARQLEIEEIIKKNNATEPEERNLEDSKSLIGKTTGGGKRIIRKGHEMGG